MPDAVVKPIRMKPRSAAAYLDVSYNTVLDLVHRGILTPIENGKRGHARRIHLLTEELDVYAAGGVAALKEHQARKRKAGR